MDQPAKVRVKEAAAREHDLIISSRQRLHHNALADLVRFTPQSHPCQSIHGRRPQLQFHGTDTANVEKYEVDVDTPCVEQVAVLCKAHDNSPIRRSDRNGTNLTNRLPVEPEDQHKQFA